MGYYTEFELKLPLKDDTPQEVLSLLDQLVKRTFWEEPVMYQVNIRPDLPIDHDFGKTTRWPQIFHHSKYEKNVLTVKGDLKNYDDEIDKLIDWLTPYIRGRKKK